MQHDPHAYLTPFVAQENAFTAQEVDAIVALGDQMRLEKASLVYHQGTSSDDPARITRTAWKGRAFESAWIYDKMERLARTLNAQVYKFDLTGFSDLFQYTVYDADQGSHFDWHVDQIRQPTHRKLSFSLQLTDPSEYEGCDLEIHAGTRIERAPRGKGTLVAFPAYGLHRVTPITAGTRKALVAWTAGPPFR